MHNTALPDDLKQFLLTSFGEYADIELPDRIRWRPQLTIYPTNGSSMHDAVNSVVSFFKQHGIAITARHVYENTEDNPNIVEIDASYRELSYLIRGELKHDKHTETPLIREIVSLSQPEAMNARTVAIHFPFSNTPPSKATSTQNAINRFLSTGQKPIYRDGDYLMVSSIQLMHLINAWLATAKTRPDEHHLAPESQTLSAENDMADTAEIIARASGKIKPANDTETPDHGHVREQKRREEAIAAGNGTRPPKRNVVPSDDNASNKTQTNAATEPTDQPRTEITTQAGHTYHREDDGRVVRPAAWGAPGK